MVRLGEIATVVGGGTPKTETESYWGGDIAWATPAEINRLSDKFISRTDRTITPAGLASSGARLLPPGSVLLSSRAPIGLVAINRVPMATNQGFKSLIPDPTRVDSGYLYWWLKSHTVNLQHLGRGATFKEISKAIVEQIDVPLPPLPEQRRIAAILDEADALRSARVNSIERIDALSATAFERAFGVPNRESSVTIGSLLDSAQYGTSAKAGTLGEFEILRMGNITASGRLDLSDLKYIDLHAKEVEKFTVRRGDVLFNRTNSADLVGKTVFYVEDLPRAYAGYLVRLRPKSELDGPFIAGYLNSRHGKAVLRGMAKSIVGMANINAKEAQSIRIPAASDLDKMDYADQTEECGRMRDVMRADLSRLDSLFASLQHRAFRGGL